MRCSINSNAQHIFITNGFEVQILEFLCNVMYSATISGFNLSSQAPFHWLKSQRGNKFIQELLTLSHRAHEEFLLSMRNTLAHIVPRIFTGNKMRSLSESEDYIY